MNSFGGWTIPAVVIAVLGVVMGAYLAVAASGDGDRESSPAAQAASKVAPQAQWVLADGDGRGLVQSYCSACHSLAPIVTHSGFTKEQWAKEVDKMRNTYGAPIDEATAAKIVAYLQATYATDTKPPKGTSELLYNDPAKN